MLSSLLRNGADIKNPALNSKCQITTSQIANCISEHEDISDSKFIKNIELPITYIHKSSIKCSKKPSFESFVSRR